MSMIDQMIAAKIAKNEFNAAAIARGLQLADLKTDEERMARARLYRKWRDAGEPPAVAYVNAIAGRQPMELILT